MNQLSRLRQLIQKASFSSSSDRHSALEIVDELIAKERINVADDGDTTIRLCEFSGDEHHYHDEVGYKKLCDYAGFQHCTLYKEPLTFTKDGWRVCVAQCTKPIQVKETK